ncbi:DUF1330 domain-containing protein [Novosphingobium lindaniclasticum]|uniref:DUF1330 domain-containing protein n=1 Tax=Novosphingobium lindaniclasticum LE124 TaxID=1096930 RepID=T0HJJ3_9SPHN|nr:DUF1330 domain-containing protein [Novosphingobium lindaniclasticum]EQB13187.1 hypothetical protein L284_14590 [Novosphingobium lindaniclasticum LE124]
MPKAYWIARVNVSDPQAYAGYMALGPAALIAGGGTLLSRGGRSVALEGPEPSERTVVIEFPSMEAAQACHDSPAYRAAREKRHGAAEVEILIVEGLD